MRLREIEKSIQEEMRKHHPQAKVHTRTSSYQCAVRITVPGRSVLYFITASLLSHDWKFAVMRVTALALYKFDTPKYGRKMRAN